MRDISRISLRMSSLPSFSRGLLVVDVSVSDDELNSVFASSFVDDLGGSGTIVLLLLNSRRGLARGCINGLSGDSSA